MNKSLDVLAKELKQEVNKIHKMTTNLPKELFTKSVIVQEINRKYQEYLADTMDQDPASRYDGKNPRDFHDLTLL